jgi:hypothetical protein
MESSSAVVRPSMTRDEAGTLLGQTMGLVALTAGLFALARISCVNDWAMQERPESPAARLRTR